MGNQTSVQKNVVKSEATEARKASKSNNPSESVQEKGFTERFDEAISSKSASSVRGVLENATPEELTALGNDKDKILSLTKLKKGADRNTCLDFVYEYVAEESAMEAVFEARFGVNLGSGSIKSYAFKISNFIGEEKEEKWTLAGAKRLYKNYLLVPQSQIDQVDSVLTSSKGESRSGGFAVGSLDCYTVRYQDDDMDRNAGYGYCSGPQDRKFNMNSLDCTMLHELGHVIDTSSYIYSKRDDFRSISGWKYEGKNAETLVKTIEDYALTPYSGELNTEERAIAHEGAVQVLKSRNRDITEDGIRQDVKKAYKKLGKSTDAKPENSSFLTKAWNFISGKSDNGDYRSLDDMLSLLVDSTVYTHIKHGLVQDSASYIPCYASGGIDSKMSRQIQEGYEGRGWYSFDNAAWNDKISRYQFREPCEEFAELYATYHVSQGTNVKSKHKQWFEGIGLHNGTQDPKKANLTLTDGEKTSDIQKT